MDVLIVEREGVERQRYYDDRYDIAFYPPLEGEKQGVVMWKTQFNDHPGVLRLKVFAQLQGIELRALVAGTQGYFAWLTSEHTIPLSTLLAVFNGGDDA